MSETISIIHSESGVFLLPQKRMLALNEAVEGLRNPKSSEIAGNYYAPGFYIIEVHKQYGEGREYDKWIPYSIWTLPILRSDGKA
jgi:hypothetical protein